MVSILHNSEYIEDKLKCYLQNMEFNVILVHKKYLLLCIILCGIIGVNIMDTFKLQMIGKINS